MENEKVTTDIEKTIESEEVNETSNDEDLEFDDDEETSNEEEHQEIEDKKTKSNQTAEEKRLAFQKRQQEKERKRLEERKKLESENFEKGIIKGSGGLNKFTGEKIVDKHDINEYMTMLEMEEKGLDATNELAYAKYLKEKARLEEKKQIEVQSKEKEQQEYMNNDIKSFTEKYPNVDVAKLIENESFTELFGNMIGKVPLVDLYSSFEKISAKTETEADKMARVKVAKSLASPKGLNSTSEDTTKTYKQMSDSEFEKMLIKAKQGSLKKN